jgi:anti-anti-sigma factor
VQTLQQPTTPEQDAWSGIEVSGPTSPPEFMVDTVEIGGQLLIRPSGSIDERSTTLLSELLRAAQTQPTPVVLDLRLVATIRPTGLVSISDADRRARLRGSRLRVIAGGRDVQDQLRDSGLDRRLLFVPPPVPLT